MTARDIDSIKADFTEALRRRHLTTEEVAELFRTSPESVRYWRHIGTGPKSFKVGRRVLYDARDIEAFIAQARGGAA